MLKRSLLVGTVAGALLTAAACGPDQPTPAQTVTASSPAATATTPAAQQPAQAGVTPGRVCELVTMAQMGRFTGFTISSTRPGMSGNVSVYHFLGTAADSTSPTSKVIIEYQPDGKGAVEFTKSRGEAVPGLGVFAVYFRTSGQLSVELGGGDAVVHVFVEDVRANHNDPKGAAVRIAQTAVPGLAH